MPNTLVLTDVVGSTQVASQLGEARNAALWRDHDRLTHVLLQDLGGQQLGRTEGLSAAFESPDAAVRFALAYLDGLAALQPPLEARVGLLLAPDATRSARRTPPVMAQLLSIAHAGQILALGAELTEAVQAVPMRSHGHWYFDAASQPLEVFEGIRGDGPRGLPRDRDVVHRVIRHGGRWLPVRELPRTLPLERDAFVGRRSDLSSLVQRLDDGVRLISVTGIGGVGKTRLATRLAWDELTRFPGGVWFSDLSEARDADGIVRAVAHCLDVPLQADAVEQLGHAIASRQRCLIVLDNLEQVARHAPETLGRWLSRCPMASFLVTTREVLGIPGELTFALPPLEPADAAELFATRSAEARSGSVHPADDDVEALVELLDHLPLAIELAAARTSELSVAQLRTHMSERLSDLAWTGAPLDRSATLRATLDSSWELLSAAERAGLAQLSTFEGGFTLDAAETVLDVGEAWPADVVQRLVDASLVRPVADERFDLLTTVQTYAAQRLGAPEREEVERRHGRTFAAFGRQESVDALRTREGPERLRALLADADNVLVACRRAILRQEPDVAVPLLRALWPALHYRGPTSVAADLARQVLALSDLTPSQRAAAQAVLGHGLWRLGALDEARDCYEAALHWHRAASERRAEGHMVGNLGDLHRLQGRFELATEHQVRALAICREVGHRGDEGATLGKLGVVQGEKGQIEESVQLLEQSLQLARETGDRQSEAVALGNLGYLHVLRRALPHAEAHLQEALELHRQAGNRRFEGIVLGHLGMIHHDAGRHSEAIARYSEALQIHRHVGSRRFEALALTNLGSVCTADGQLDAAEAHLLEALAIYDETQNPGDRGQVLRHLGVLRAEGRDPDGARACWDDAEATLRACDAQVGLGLLHADRALWEGRWGTPAAEAHLAEAERIARALDTGPEDPLSRALQRARIMPAEVHAGRRDP
ncbi:MAG: tetratricopeptide repeat protein [Myxococcales bacterium]|nr:tetratricopeptide repeat protein [Myxococcales bacterium]